MNAAVYQGPHLEQYECQYNARDKQYKHEHGKCVVFVRNCV